MGAKSSKIQLKNDDEKKDSSVKENNTRSSSPNDESVRDIEDPSKNDNLFNDILKDEEVWLDA